MKKIKLSLLVLLLMAAINCSKDEPDQPTIDPLAVLTPDEINQAIFETIDSKGDFNWMDASDQLLWSAVVHGDGLLTVGYGKDYDFQKNKSENQLLKERILLETSNLELKANPKLKSAEDILLFEDEELTIIDLKISSLETLIELKNSEDIRYLEPGAYQVYETNENLKSALSSGCTTDSDAINADDKTTLNPGYDVSWSFYQHNVPQAWQYSRGQGITVGLIDTGVSDYVPELGSGFSNSYSPNRSITKRGVFVDSAWPWATKTDGVHDKCGHGTRMAASLAAPLNDRNLPVGVANNCNLIVYRATKNVVLDGYHEQKGVARALTELGNNSSVKVISMSLGHIFTVNRIKDAVLYANDRGKLIFAAGGTSTSITNWLDVIFPANMNETVAVTGIMDNGYNECNTCHKGSKIDFTVVMQRSSDYNRLSATLGYYDGEESYAGGSSVSTAITAGIAALVWSRNPGWNKDQVFDRLKQSADLYPNKDDYFGYGNIDALAAVQ